MYAVCVSFKIKPGMMEKFMPLMQQQARLSLERENACHHFDICTDPVRTNEVFLYELYSDAAAFQRHLASKHFKQFDQAVADMLADKTINTYMTVYQGGD